ncbi:alpha/beta hydrolase fold domain-containing protein [Marinobacter sp.]|uniref:alpha/beta hydrolase fold domain-containing protein n=1 Tax=Marinobacter sp. TaxID=50741 RepID=UPI0035634C4B
MRTLPLKLFLVLLWLSGRRRRFGSAEAMRRAVARDRRRSTGHPPAEVTRRFSVRRTRRAVDGRLHECFSLSDRSQNGQVQVLYLHGGAHCMEMTVAHWRFLAFLVKATGCVVHVPLFPLAPENDHRDAFPVVLDLYRKLSEAHPAEHLVIMGDSSGGGFALTLAQMLVPLHLPQPRDIVLISPWLDMTVTYPRSVSREIDDPWLDIPGLIAAAEWWTGNSGPSRLRVSPLEGPFRGLGRLSVFIGQRDILIAESRALHDRARKEGAHIEVIEEPGMIHVWPLLPLKEGQAARERIAAIVRADVAE